MKYLLGLFLVLFFIVPAAESAETKKVITAKSLPEVVVKSTQNQASMTTLSADAARVEMNRIPGGFNLVEAREYKKGRSSNLHDTLGFEPGVYVQPRFGAEEARISIRGSGLQRTFHLRGIKLLQDGIPINQADGGGDFQAIEPLALDHIEVYRGANALQYGSTTLGGAINFVSPTGYTASPAQARLEFGSFGYLREQVSSGAVLGPVDYYISLSELRQEGFRNHAQQWNRRLYSNYGVQLGDTAETRFYVNVSDSDSQLPGNLTMGQMKRDPQQSNAANVTGHQKRDYDLVQLGNKTTVQWGEQTFDTGVFYARKDLFHPIFQVIDQLSHDIAASFRYLNKNELFSRKNILTLGVNPAWNFMNAQQHVNSGGQRGARTTFAIQRSTNLELYGEDQFYVLDKLALVGGAQWAYADRRSQDRFLSDGDNSAHPHFVGFSPKVGLRYEFTDQNQIFANFSRSFEPPSFGELSNVTTGGLRDMRKQLGSTVEIGTRGAWKRLDWDTAYYYSWIENEMLGLNAPNGVTLGTINAGKTRHQGIESGAGVSLFEGIFAKAKMPESHGGDGGAKKFSIKRNLFGIEDGSDDDADRIYLRGVYNWSAFRFERDLTYSNNPLPGIPPHMIRGELLYEHPLGFYFGPNTEMATEYAIDMKNTSFTMPYALLGIKGGFRNDRGVSFFVEGRNLTNEIYSSTTGVIADANGADTANFLPGDGRAVYSGFEFRW